VDGTAGFSPFSSKSLSLLQGKIEVEKRGCPKGAAPDRSGHGGFLKGKGREKRPRKRRFSP